MPKKNEKGGAQSGEWVIWSCESCPVLVDVNWPSSGVSAQVHTYMLLVWDNR